MKSNIYPEKGYENREEYLNDLSDSYGVPSFAVSSLAEMLGPNEDFDGLPIALEDYADMFCECEISSTVCGINDF